MKPPAETASEQLTLAETPPEQLSLDEELETWAEWFQGLLPAPERHTKESEEDAERGC
jgi:hypothetical protein